LQDGTNRSGPRFAENAISQFDAKLGDSLLELKCRTVPSAAGFAVTQIDPIKALAICSRDPQIDSTLAEPEFARCLSNAHTGTHRLHHRATARFQQRFLAMANSMKKRKRYSTCPANADTRLSGER
jgi:hypothetical protein